MSSKMLEILRKTPAFRRWEIEVPSAQGDWRFYQQISLRVDMALCLIDILTPSFIELQGLYIRESDRKPEKILEQLQTGSITSQQAEYILNHLHIRQLFQNDPSLNETDPSVFHWIADKIANSWSCHLHRLFPAKEFEIGVSGDEYEPEVFAYQRVSGI
jgi:hypothetical protein